LFDSDQNSVIGFIYEAMDQAKEKIQKAFNVVKRKGISHLTIYIFVKIVILKWKTKN